MHAVTDVAALHIVGHTLHSLLNLPTKSKIKETNSPSDAAVTLNSQVSHYYIAYIALLTRQTEREKQPVRRKYLSS